MTYNTESQLPADYLSCLVSEGLTTHRIPEATLVIKQLHNTCIVSPRGQPNCQQVKKYINKPVFSAVAWHQLPSTLSTGKKTKCKL